mmetsp:Transcript_31059/g.105368  ORF Transcript_31059/g.105368 Transcript_31059/m.105368 type:complete len:92 (-) Transcript_31059:22-297(-)
MRSSASIASSRRLLCPQPLLRALDLGARRRGASRRRVSQLSVAKKWTAARRATERALLRPRLERCATGARDDGAGGGGRQRGERRRAGQHR